MEDKDKTTEAAAGAPDANQASEANQKSDKSPEELMGQVAQADGSLESGPKQSAVDAMADESNQDKPAATAKPKPKSFKALLGKLNIYLLLFILVVVIAAAAFVVFYFMNQREQNLKIQTTKLTEETLEQLKTSDAIVGDPQQILTIESNAVISGKVVMRDTLDVAGALRIGGALSLPSIQAAGAGNFGSIATNDLQAAGNAAIGGLLDVAGGGATASINGTDTAATVTINTGGGPGTGVLATVFFTGAFNSNNPHPILTPNGPGCANIGYYVTNVSATQFAIATASAPPAGTTCRFNYIVIN